MDASEWLGLRTQSLPIIQLLPVAPVGNIISFTVGFAQFCNLNKYIFRYGQIHFFNLYQYILQFVKIYFVIPYHSVSLGCTGWIYHFFHRICKRPISAGVACTPDICTFKDHCIPIWIFWFECLKCLKCLKCPHPWYLHI